MNNEEYEIEWEALEYEYYPKNILWFWSSIFIAIIILIIAIWQKNFLFAIFIIIAEVLILIWGNHTPRILKFKINKDGIYIDQYTLYNFEEISNFSTTSSLMDELTIIKLNFKNKLKFNTTILVPNNILEEIKNIFYEKNIPEIEYEEHFIDSLQKILKF
ncbi:MAG: hypothetical protein NZ484_00995 [Patescibacteria group bacterium]|nr:hypothetical protein [Patescibacteria group bacterium]MCX7589525.1 hypothetical protein [Patescibacteria group bacterium]MDW8279947.1 hypothetical protein [bacterium]